VLIELYYHLFRVGTRTIDGCQRDGGGINVVAATNSGENRQPPNACIMYKLFGRVALGVLWRNTLGNVVAAVVK